MTDRAGSWLEATACRFDLFDVGVPSDDPRWIPLTAVLDSAWLRGALGTLEAGNGHGPRPRSVVGSYFAADLAWQVVTTAGIVLHADGRALDLGLDHLAVRIDDQGWPSRVALVDPTFAALAADPAVGSPGVSAVGDRDALLDHLAERIVETMRPVFTAVRAQTPYGLAGMWGALADHVANLSWNLRDAEASAEELDGAWATTEALIDRIAVAEPRLKARPRRFTFRTPDGTVQLPMRSTCCLYYLTPEADAAEGDGKCTTCPLRDDEDRIARVEAGFANPTH